MGMFRIVPVRVVKLSMFRTYWAVRSVRGGIGESCTWPGVVMIHRGIGLRRHVVAHNDSLANEGPDGRAHAASVALCAAQCRSSVDKAEASQPLTRCTAPTISSRSQPEDSS